ncbi:MAG: flagellar hook-basal body complex protein FliE [Thermoplasmatales archaeon]|nr:flagellar hook-basal body complex protein FliE [Thermoplasmatales archaeon]
MKIISLVGMPGSGKGVFVETAKKKGWNVVRMGDTVWEFVRKKGLILNDENVGRIADEERKKHGYGIWAERTLRFIKNKKTVIDGIRSAEEIKVFRRCFQEFTVVGIHSSPETRYRRIMKRKRIDDVFSKEKFDERDKRELSWGIGKVIALSDVVIVNEGGVDGFRENAEKILEKYEISNVK